MKQKYPKYFGYGAVYALISPSNKIYVGQTTTPICKRIGAHNRDSKKGSKLWIHQAIKKYGIDNFKVRLLATSTDQDGLDWLEKFFIDYLKAYISGRGYNMAAMPIGTSEHAKWKRKVSRFGHKHSEATLLKMRLAAKMRWSDLTKRAEHSKLLLGKAFTEQHKAALRKPKSSTIKMKKPKSEQHKKALSIAKLKYNQLKRNSTAA